MEMVRMIDEVPFGKDVNEVEIDQQQDDMKADESLIKIGNWERYRKYWLDFYQKKIDEVNQLVDRNVFYQKRILRAYFDTVPHKATKMHTQESYELPSGKLIMKFPKPKFIPDNEALLKKFKESGEEEYIKTTVKEEIKWNDYKSCLFIDDEGNVVNRNTGEYEENVGVDYGTPTFDIKDNKKGETEDE